MGETLTFIKRSFCPQVAAATVKALGPDGKEVWSELLNGDSECWEIPGKGYLITRLEDQDGHRTFVVVAAEGRNAITVLKKLIEIVEANGADRIRIHSRRPGMGRYLEKAGFIFQRELGKGEVIFHGEIKKLKQTSING